MMFFKPSAIVAVHFLLITSLFLSSCDTVKEYSGELLDAVGLKDLLVSPDKKSPKGKKDKSASTSKTPGNDDDDKQENLSDDDVEKPSDTENSDPNKLDTGKDSDIVITTDEKSKDIAAKDTNLKTAVAVEFKVEAPVHVLKRVGGIARLIRADENYIYMDYPQHFAVYDKSLNLLATVPIKFPLKSVKSFSAEGQTLFYLSEENDVFEILRLTQNVNGTNTSYSLNELISKEMKSNYYVLDPVTILVFDKDKVSFLDFADVSKIKIINELPQGNVRDAIKLGNALYLARGDFLDIVNPDNGTLLSSVRIGKNFGFIGIKEQDEQKSLFISYPNHNGDLDGIQRLKLTPDMSGVSDFAENFFLPVPLSQYSVDLDSGLIVGRESGVKTDSPIQLYSITEKRFLRGILSEDINLRAWSFLSGQLYLVNDKAITVNSVNLDQQVISQDKSLQKMISGQSNVPLAQIGASKLVRDEYNLGPIRTLEFMSDSRKVSLLDKNHFIIIENTKDGRTQRAYATKDFQNKDFFLTEPAIAMPTSFDKILSTSVGFFAYSAETGKIYLMDIDFERLTPLPLQVGNLISWAQFSTKNGEVLALSQQPTTKSATKGKAEETTVTFYQIVSEQNLKPITTVTTTEPAFVFYVPDNQVIILTKSKIDLYDWPTLSGEAPVATATQTDTQTATQTASIQSLKVASKDPQPQESVDIKSVGMNFISAKISPANDTVYALIQQNEVYKIFVLNIFDISDTALLDDIEITPEHFEGSTFSKEGRLFIMPSQVGTIFYDMTALAQVKEVAHWPLLSYYVDVADRGQYVCVALGYQGVYCGDLLF